MRRAGLLWVAVVAVTINGCSNAGDAKPGAADQRAGRVGTGGAGANLSDDEFVRDMALKSMAAVELSRVALEKTTNRDLESFAQRMVDDYGAAGHNLKSVLSGQPIEWPGQLDEKHEEMAVELAKKQGADFDHDYLEAMIETHQDLTAKLESRLDVQSLADWKAAAAGRTDTRALPDPNTSMRDVHVRPNRSGNETAMKINQWAADTYPIAQKHLDTARTLDAPTNRGSTK